MIWTREANPWRKHFAILPITIRNGPLKWTTWAEWVWLRNGGDCTEVSLTDPAKPGLGDQLTGERSARAERPLSPRETNDND